MSIDSKLLPLLDNSLEEIQTIHDILFSVKSSFSSAIMERPSCSNTKDVPRLFDGEKVLLTGIDRALLHAKNTAAIINAQRKDVLATVKSAERSHANYVTALQRLAKARNCNRPSATPKFSGSSKRLQKNTNIVGSCYRDLLPRKLSSMKTRTSSIQVYPPATKTFAASPSSAPRFPITSSNLSSVLPTSSFQCTSAQPTRAIRHGINANPKTTANPENCQKSGKKSKKEKQRAAPSVSSSKTVDMSSIPSMTGSSLDEIIANFPIEDDQTEQFMIDSDKFPLPSANMKSPNAKISLKEETVDSIFGDSLPEVDIDSVAPGKQRSESGSQKMTMNRGNKQTMAIASTRKSKRAVALAGAVYNEEFPSDNELWLHSCNMFKLRPYFQHVFRACLFPFQQYSFVLTAFVMQRFLASFSRNVTRDFSMAMSL